MTILHVINSMRKEVEGDRLDLKDKKKEKVLNAMNELNSETLNGFLKSYGNLTLRQTELIRHLDSMEIIHQLASSKKNIQSLNEERAEIQRRKDVSHSKLKSLDSEPVKEGIVSLALDLGIELFIN